MPAPDALIKISQKALSLPQITKAGITKTADGQYALLATIRKSASSPVAEIEEMAKGFPVIYREEEDVLPVAWPARPGQG